MRAETWLSQVWEPKFRGKLPGEARNGHTRLMSADASPTIRRRQLGAALEGARKEKGLSREDVADHLDVKYATVQRFEGGHGSLSASTLTALLNLFGITDEAERARLENLRREGKQRSWWSAHRSTLRNSFATYIGLENSAVAAFVWSTTTIPGLLQTEPYARAVMLSAIPPLPDATIESRVKVRMTRQEWITGSDTPHGQQRKERLLLHVVLDEGCLRRRVGGEDVWRAQLQHLLIMAKKRNVKLQVVTATEGALVGGLGGFTLLSFAGEDPSSDDKVAYVELPTSDLFLKGSDARPFVLHSEALVAMALDEQQSVTMIKEILDEPRE
jgi:transcriptional regulator with XRE-family HTH domain